MSNTHAKIWLMSSAAPRRRSHLRTRFALRLCFIASTALAASCLTPGFDDLGDDLPAPMSGGAFSAGGGPANGGNAPASGGAGGEGGNPDAEHCQNNRFDADEPETDTDCGGECPPCEADRKCEFNSDCQSQNCIDDVCKLPSCTDKVKNQGEVNVDCGGPCDGCPNDSPCIGDEDCESLTCITGTCQAATCGDARKNNDETDTDCGGTFCTSRCEVGEQCKIASDCAMPGGENPGLARCVQTGSEKTCQLECPPKLGDCDERASTGCETETETDLAHCGECGKACEPPHTNNQICDSGVCTWDKTQPNDGCDTGYADCDGDPANGCEINIRTDPDYCGDCNTECSDANGTPSCRSGVCQIVCKDDFENCDNDAGGNGCEINIKTNAANCNGCGTDDSIYICEPDSPTESAYCADGVCGSIDCSSAGPNLRACDGDGICDDSIGTPESCSNCGDTCLVENGTGACEMGSPNVCVVDACDAGYEDCDGSYSNGCEVDTRADSRRCGGCLGDDPIAGTGDDCEALSSNASLHVASASCALSSCQIECDPGYGDCDGVANNGCEVVLTNNAARCGGCLPTDPNPANGENCSSKWPNAAESTCTSGGTCALDCDTNYQNCTSTLTDGCESNVSSGIASCGACGIYCGGDSSQTNVSAAACSAGTCNVTCAAGFCPDLSNPERPCTGTTGTLQNCASCGNTCTGTNPFCDTSGTAACRQRFPVQIVQTVRADTASVNGQARTYTIPNVAGPGSGRMLLAVVASTSNVLSIAMGTTPLLPAGRTDASNEGHTGVVAAYYLPDASLGAAGSKSIVVTNEWGTSFTTVYELKYADQSAIGLAKAGTATDCTTAVMNVQTAATVTSLGSAIFAGMFAQGGSAATGNPIGGLTEVSELFNSSQGTAFHGHRLGVSSQATVGWGISGQCWWTGLGAFVVGPWISP
jgi:hypothetical protein